MVQNGSIMTEMEGCSMLYIHIDRREEEAPLSIFHYFNNILYWECLFLSTTKRCNRNYPYDMAKQEQNK